jgi:superfamily II DNA or RNA helicase
MNHWHCKFELRAWQSTALEKWKISQRGTLQVVTGGGKTIFAQHCILEFFKDDPDGKALIIVPTFALLDQWTISLQEDLHVLDHEIGFLTSSETPLPSAKIVIAVVNSARSFSEGFALEQRTFLICDECHRFGSPENAKALVGNFQSTLGLSATPVREYDSGFHDYVEPQLGSIFFKYGYEDAFSDGVICPFKLINVEIDLLADESEEYNKVNRYIARCFNKDGMKVGSNERLKTLLQRRSAISSNATMRIPTAIKLVALHSKERIVIFHEKTEAATHIYDNLVARGHAATIYHTGIGPNLRRDNLRLFRQGQFDVLVCCKALDEGLNVPSVSVGIIASSTASYRQRIQRLGRILRTTANKNSATVYTVFATQEEAKRLRAEALNFEGIAEVSWFRTTRHA